MNEVVILNTNIREDADGLYCLNDLHKASGGEQKNQPRYWLANQQTKDLIAEMTATRIPLSEQKRIVMVRKGGNGIQGTFVCKKLVYAYAMWISATFCHHVIQVYSEMVANQQTRIQTPKPYSQVLREYAEEIERKERL